MGDADGRKPVEEGGVTDGIKGCTQVEENEDGEESRISCHKKVVGDLDKCCFSAMEWAATGLELFIQVIM